ncbi:MAG: alanine--tRNA ligase-related protein [Candidatus Aminicenantes bacterium]|jgi:alanyl-tRNA synthetase
MTETLYYQDTSKSEFEARILEVVEEKKAWRVVLDKTYFYPEGGGQPADKGWLNDIPVSDVQKQENIVYHYLPENPGQGTIKGKIDMGWRKDFMQQHTGQHIISGALWQVGKYKTVSIHLGNDYATIEIDAPEIPEQDLIRVEKLANRVIRENLPLSFIHTQHQDLEQFPLRKPTDREGKIRLVKIGDFDCVACGGVHLDSTRQVGLVKAIGTEKIRDHTRIAWKIGDRAYEDYWKKDKIISQLKSILATNQDMFARKVKDLQEDFSDFKRQYSWLENRLAGTIAQQLLDDAQNQAESDIRIITASWKEENDNLIKKILKDLLKREKVLVCLVNGTASKLQWSIGSSEDMVFPFDEINDELLSIIEGKGGGRHPLWQGVGLKPQGAKDFIAKFRMIALQSLDT